MPPWSALTGQIWDYWSTNIFKYDNKLWETELERFSSVQLFSHSVVSDSLRSHESQQARPPCPSPTPRVHSDSHPLSQWCHPAISSSVVPFSSCPQSLPASGSFPMSQLFTWGGQSTGVSALASLRANNKANGAKCYKNTFFSNFFRRKVRSFMWDFSCFLRQAYITVKSFLKTAFALSHRFWKVVFLFFFRLKVFFDIFSDFFDSLVFSSILFSLHVCVVFFFLKLISSFMPLWLEKMFDTIPIFLNLLRLVLWPSTWSILERGPCALKKSVYPVALG